jgi:hypothetical protein
MPIFRGCHAEAASRSIPQMLHSSTTPARFSEIGDGTNIDGL